MKIAALVTSYNDPAATIKCVNALLSQTLPLSGVLIIDNSEKQSVFVADFDVAPEGSATLVVSHFSENIGIAGAIHAGIVFATSNLCNFLWTFDQDSVPQGDALEKLIATVYFENIHHRGLFASLPYDEGQRRFLFGYQLNGFKFEEIREGELGGPYFCDGTITAGMLIPVLPSMTEHLPIKSLFIDGVDHALCLSFLAKGQKVLMVPRSQLRHNMGQPARGRLLFGGLSYRTVHNYSPLRKFFIARNHSYLETRLAMRNGCLSRAILWRLRVAYYMIRESLYERQEWLWASIWSVALGTLLGMFGKLVHYNKLPFFLRKRS